MKKILNQSGFALMEVMVAAGLLGVIAYLFMQMGEQVTNMEFRMKNSMEAADIQNQMQLHFSGNMACMLTMAEAFKKLKTNEKAYFPLEIDKVYGKYGNTLLDKDRRYGALSIESIHLAFDSSSIEKENFDQAVGIINLHYSLVSTGKFHFRKNHRVSLSALIANPKSSSAPYFLECMSPESNLKEEIIVEVTQNICKSMNVKYNPLTGGCLISDEKRKAVNVGGGSISTPQNLKSIESAFKNMGPEEMKKLQEEAKKMIETYMKQSSNP